MRILIEGFFENAMEGMMHKNAHFPYLCEPRKHMSQYDLLIVGAGPVGCVIAERAARVLNWKSLILDKRSHVAGNCFDTQHKSGVMIHQYGPHYFRTNKQEIVDYLSEFTEWLPGNYIVKCSVNGKLYPFPINLDTLRSFFDREFSAESAKEYLDTIREKIDLPKNSEEFVLSRVGKELYEAFYLGYTLKQWGKHPSELDPSVCGRIPIRFNDVNTYVDHTFQIIPKEGYTAMFSAMISHPNITKQTGTEYSSVKNNIIPKRATLYTGAIDEYFGYSLGKLPWRSLEFDFVEKEKKFDQECVQINYPNEHEYTRSVEIKHVTKQEHPHTVISYEYPKAEGDPFYPVPAPENRALYEKYKLLAEAETLKNKVYFAGRLAQYAYINTDEAIEIGLSTFDKIRKDFDGK